MIGMGHNFLPDFAIRLLPLNGMKCIRVLLSAICSNFVTYIWRKTFLALAHQSTK